MRKGSFLVILPLLFVAFATWGFLVPQPPVAAETVLSKELVVEDLEKLKMHLSDRFAYLDYRKADPEKDLDSIVQILPDKITKRTLSLALQKYFCKLGDPHTRVLGTYSLMRQGYFPFRITLYQDRVLCLAQNEQKLLNENHPYLSAVNGIEVERLLAKAGEYESQSSAYYNRKSSLLSLTFIRQILYEMDALDGDNLQVELTNEDRSKTKTIKAKMTLILPKTLEFKYKNGIIAANIAYLGIPVMSNSQRMADTLVAQMNRIKKSDGLVIDLRNNGGGGTKLLKTLFPFFMDKKDAHQVLSVAAYRKNGGDNHAEGYLKDWFLFPLSSAKYDEEQADFLRSYAYNFKPEWTIPDDKFSNWHFMMVEPPQKDPRYYYYDKPIVILMNHQCLGAAEIFLGAFKGRENVTLMGAPSGGANGSPKSFKLPNSKIRIKLSTMASFGPDGKLYLGNGIQPDVVLEDVLTDAIGSTDTQLNDAIKYLLN